MVPWRISISWSVNFVRSCSGLGSHVPAGDFFCIFFNQLPNFRRIEQIYFAFEDAHGFQPQEKQRILPSLPRINQAEAPAPSVKQPSKQRQSGAKHSKCCKEPNDKPPKHGITPIQFMPWRGLLFLFYYICIQKGSPPFRFFLKNHCISSQAVQQVPSLEAEFLKFLFPLWIFLYLSLNLRAK